ncbi:MAG: hypothetical protein ABIH21_00990 [Patescibacteria group bacterium]
MSSQEEQFRQQQLEHVREQNKKFPVVEKTKDEYIQECIEHALELGWLKEADMEVFKTKYLIPVFETYTQELRGVQEILELEDEITRESVWPNVLRRANNVLETMKRVGATDPQNILRTIVETKRSCRDDYSKQVVTVLMEKVVEVLKEE